MSIFGQYSIFCVGNSFYGIVLLSLEGRIVFGSWSFRKYRKLQPHASQNIKLPCCLIICIYNELYAMCLSCGAGKSHKKVRDKSCGGDVGWQVASSYLRKVDIRRSPVML